MKTNDLVVLVIAASVPLAALIAQETDRPGKVAQKQEQSSDSMGMKGMDKMSEEKNSDSELGKLVSEMNNAPAEKKVEAMAAVLNKLVEQKKAMCEMQGMMGTKEGNGMDMCRTMMDSKDHRGDHK